MNEYSKLKEYLSGFGSKGIAITQGIVKSVTGNLCDVEIGNIVIPDVRIRASELDDAGEMLVTPKIGSAVILGSLSGDLSQLVVLRVDHIESIIINGGKLGGLVNIEQLTNKINELVNTFNTHTHNVTVSHPGGTFATVTPGSSASSFNKDDYEDENIKH